MPEKILIIDDVVTTGQTVGNLASQLRVKGVKTVAVWALARTQRQRNLRV